jgi:hypothetical protein
MHVFSLLFWTIMSGPFAVTSLSVCTPWFHHTVTSSCSHTGLGVLLCVCTVYLSVCTPWFHKIPYYYYYYYYY